MLGSALLIRHAAAQHGRRVAHVRVGELDAQLPALAVDGEPLVPPLVQRADADLERARHPAGELEHREQLRVRARVREEHALGRAADGAQHGEVVAAEHQEQRVEVDVAGVLGPSASAMRCATSARDGVEQLLRHVVAAHLRVERRVPVEAPREVVHVQRADALERGDLVDRALDGPVVQLHVADQRDEPARLGRLDERPRLLRRERERLLDEHVLAGGDRRRGDRGVVVGADDDRVDRVGGDELAVVGRAQRDAVLLAELVDDARREVAEPADRVLRQLEQERQVHHLRDLAAADHADADGHARAHRSSAPPSTTLVVPVT